MDAQKNPYIGPRTFQRDEGHLFFGREREARDLIALVASERLVVFYAQSGAGKSSIVNTRLIPNLEGKGYEVLPVGRVSGDTGTGITLDNIYVYNLLRSLDQHGTDPAVLGCLSLSEFLAHLNFDDTGFFYDPAPVEALPVGDDSQIARRAVVIDQFEELFSTHPEAWEKREEFFQQLAQAMQDDPQLWAVLVMREDFVAALDPYAHLVPNGLRVRYYMQRLGREAGLKAVKSPVEEIRPYAEGVAEKLIDDLCSIKVQQPDGTLDVQPGQYVEPVQMQVVCYGLWDNLSPEGMQITEKDLQDVGDVNQSLGKYYDKRVGDVARAKNVRERLIREWFEKKLITAGGIRNMVLQEHETKPGELDDDVIQALQSDLVRGEKRGGATWYELTHDRLVEPILERNKIWFNENLSPLQRQAALWKDQDQNESWLLTGEALHEVEDWAKAHQDELTETEGEFLEACQKAQNLIEERQAQELRERENERKFAEQQARSAQIARRFSLVAGAAALLALIAFGFAINSSVKANQSANSLSTQSVALSTSVAEAKAAQQDAQEKSIIAQQNSDFARSGQLSFSALDKADSELDLAILLGLQADSIYPSDQTQKTLLTLMQKSHSYIRKHAFKDDVSYIQYAPDGKSFALLDKNGITFWDSEKHETRLGESLNGHYGPVKALTLSKDGRLMATGGGDGTILIWDVVKRQIISTQPKAHSGEVRGLAFSPDSKILASSSWNEKNVILWDLSKPSNPQPMPKQLINDNSIIRLAFSPDGKTLATGDVNGSILLWSVETQERIGEPLKGHSGAIFGIAFTPDGKTLASGSYDDTVIRWDISDSKKPKQIGKPLTGHGIDIETIAVSPDSATLASGDDNSNIILWDTKTGSRKNDEPLKGNSGWVVSLAFSPDGKTLAAGYSYPGNIILWDVEKQTQIATIPAPNYAVWGIAFDRSGKTLITGSEDSTIFYWDISNPKNPQKSGPPLRGHPGQPTAFHFSSDGSLLATDGNDGTVLFDVKSRASLGYGNILVENSESNLMAYELNDGAGGENIIHLRNSVTGQELGAISGKNPHFSVDGSLLFYETVDQDTQKITLNIWDVAQGKNLDEKFEGTYLGFNPQSSALIYQTTSPNGDPQIVFWDTQKSVKIKTITAKNSSEPNVNQDGTILVYVSYNSKDGKSYINSLDTATTNILISPKDIGSGNIVGFSTNGRVLLYTSVTDGVTTIGGLDTTTNTSIISAEYGSSGVSMPPVEFDEIIVYSYYTQHGDNRIKVINTKTTKELADLKGYYLDLVKNGQLLVYSDEKGINLFDVTQARPIGNPIQGTYLAISPNGKALITRNNVNTILFWDLTKSWPLGSPLRDQTVSSSNFVLSPDGKTLARIDSTGITILDTKTGSSRGGPFIDHAGGPSGSYPAFSPDGKWLAVGNGNNTTMLWDVNAQKQIVTEDIIPGFSPVFSPDGKWLAVGNPYTNTTILWDVNAQKRIATEQDLTGFLPVFSPDGKWLAVGNYQNNTIILWDLTVQKLVDNDTDIPGSYPAFSPDGKILAVGNGYTAATTLWDVNTQEQVVTEKDIPGTFPVFNPDSKWLAVGNGNDNTTILWDMVAQKQVVTDTDILGTNLVFSPDSKWLAVGNTNNSTTTLWDMATQKQILAEEDILGSNPVFSPDNKWLAVGNSNNITTLLDMDAQEQIVTKEDIPGFTPIFSPDGKWLAVGNGNNTTSFWEVNSQEGKIEFLPVPVSGTSVVFSLNGQFMASYHPLDGFVIRDLVANKITTRLTIDDLKATNYDGQATSSMGFIENNSQFVALGDDGTLITWDLASGKPTIHNDSGQKFTPNTINPVFSPDEKYLIYGNGKSLSIWNLVKDEPFSDTVETIELSQNDSYVIKFNQDGTVMSLSDGKSISLYSFPKLTKIGGELPIASPIIDMTLVMDGANVKYLIVVDNAGVTQIWDWTTGTKIAEPMPGSLRWFGSSTLDQPEVYLDSNGRLIQFEWKPDHKTWQELLCRAAARNFSLAEWNLYFPGEDYPTKDLLTCPDYPAG